MPLAIPDPGAPRLGWHGLLTLYAGFAAGVAVVTWPLVLSPATLWPPHHDARVFTWVMASMARRLVTDPLALFHGNAFYPFGESLAFTEILLPPVLLGLPGFLWGNSVLTYNLLLLALWPLNGVAMAWTAHQLTGSRPAAWLAGTVFCLSPYFTEYYLEFQMLLAALLPVVMLAWLRWLETQEHRWLLVALAGLTVQALTTWYYTIILGLALVTLAVGFLCLRWYGWRWRRSLGGLVVGGLGLAAVLLPFALPYLAVHRELSYERGVEETASHYADLATFVEPARRSLLYRFAPSGHIAETSAFTGFSVLALGAASLAWLRHGTGRAACPSWVRRVLLGIFVAVLLAAIVLMFQPLRYRLGPFRISLRPAEFLDLGILLGLALLLVHGFAAWRVGEPRRLGEGDLVRLLLLLAGVFAILALGPVIHVARREVAPGPYLALYHLLLPLHVVRVTVRFAVVSIAAIALLAALGLRVIEERLRPSPRLRRCLLIGVFLVLAGEYAVRPATYEPVPTTPRLVDVQLRADPDDVAVLEWPTNFGETDADAMFHSLGHGKRLVNGLSGVVPALLPELSAWLTTPGTPFPVPEAQTRLRSIYPLRYLVVRLQDPQLGSEWRAVWQALRDDPPALLRFIGSFGTDDLYEVVATPDRGVRLERWVSYDFLRRHPVMRLSLRPTATGADLDQWAEVRFHGRSVARIPLNEPTSVALALEPPYLRAAPNVIALDYRYRRPPSALDERHRIGTTGTRCPGDLRVASIGQPHGSASTIQLNGVELSRNRRGYNLVALDQTGRVLESVVFDTFLRPEAATQLAAWVASLPPGTIVAGAVRDEASGQLTAEAVEALRGLGVAGDLRGHFREAHAFVGVKGAPTGSAVEALGPHPVALTVGAVELVPGRSAGRLGLTLERFALEREPSRSTTP